MAASFFMHLIFGVVSIGITGTDRILGSKNLAAFQNDLIAWNVMRWLIYSASRQSPVQPRREQ